MWNILHHELPQINKPFIVLNGDGSGAMLFKRVDQDNYMDENGEDGYTLEHLEDVGSFEWAYLPDGFKFWHELKG